MKIPATVSTSHLNHTPPTARELVDQLLHRSDWHTPDKTDILAARVDRVLALHRGREMSFGEGYSSQVETLVICQECDESVPCPTVRILNGEEP